MYFASCLQFARKYTRAFELTKKTNTLIQFHRKKNRGETMAPNHVIGKKNLLTQGFCGSHISNGLVIYGSRGSQFLTRVLHNGDFRLTKCNFY